MKRQICGGENEGIGKCENAEKGCEIWVMSYELWDLSYKL
jgi:hypothetical protein